MTCHRKPSLRGRSSVSLAHNANRGGCESGRPLSRKGRNMTAIEKEKVRYLRGEGLGYKALASRLALSVDAVKGFCRRSGLDGKAAQSMGDACRQCGKPLVIKPKSGSKKYCSDSCRSIWWRKHPYFQRSENESESICAFCGCVFYSFKSKNRKYCCRSCAMRARYGEVRVYGKRTV